VKISKYELTHALGIDNLVKIVTFVSVWWVKHLDEIFHLIGKDQISFYTLIDVIMSFGTQCFYELVHEHKIKNIWHIIRLMKAVRRTLKSYVEVSRESCPFIQFTGLRYVESVFSQRNLNVQDRLAFIEFVSERSTEFLGEKIILDRDDIEKLLNRWYLIKIGELQ
jgi:hypothetical protein